MDDFLILATLFLCLRFSSQYALPNRWIDLLPDIILKHVPATTQPKRQERTRCNFPDSKDHGANMGPIWGRQDPGGPHVDPMNFARWVIVIYCTDFARMCELGLRTYKDMQPIPLCNNRTLNSG